MRSFSNALRPKYIFKCYLVWIISCTSVFKYSLWYKYTLSGKLTTFYWNPPQTFCWQMVHNFNIQRFCSVCNVFQNRERGSLFRAKLRRATPLVCLLSQYFSTSSTTTNTETKYAFILQETEIWDNRPQIVSCLWLEREQKGFHSNVAKMPIYFYKRNRTVTFILENKFLCISSVCRRKHLKSNIRQQASAMLTECNVILFTLIWAVCNLSLPVLVN